MRKPVTIVLSFLFLGVLSLILDMPYYWADSMGEPAIWKDITSAAFIVFFVSFLIFSLFRKDRNAVKGIWIYGMICLFGCIPIIPWFVFTGLGLFQPGFSLIGRLLTNAENDGFGVGGPIALIFLATVSTWVFLSATPPEDKGTTEKAENVDMNIEAE